MEKINKQENYGAKFKTSPYFYVISRIVVYFFIAIIIFPLLYTLSLSLRSPDTVYSARFFLIPEEFSFENYVIAFTYNFHGVTFPRMFLNSAIVVTASVSLIIILSIFSASGAIVVVQISSKISV